MQKMFHKQATTQTSRGNEHNEFQEMTLPMENYMLFIKLIVTFMSLPFSFPFPRLAFCAHAQ